MDPGGPGCKKFKNTVCIDYITFQPMPVICQQHSDCNIPYLCKENKCQEAKSFEELMILTAAYDVGGLK